MERPRRPRVRYRTLREIIQDRLTADIVHARLRPGQKLVEVELARVYGVSRGPVREALRALEGQGLVRLLSNRRAVVTRLTSDQLRELYDIRIELDGLAARLAAPALTDRDIAHLEHLLVQMDRSLGNLDAWLAFNDTFHLTLYRASGRSRLCALIEDLMAAIQPYARLYVNLPGRAMDTHADHHLLLASAKARDAMRLEAQTQEHLARAAAIIVDHVRQAELHGEI